MVNEFLIKKERVWRFSAVVTVERAQIYHRVGRQAKNWSLKGPEYI